MQVLARQAGFFADRVQIYVSEVRNLSRQTCSARDGLVIDVGASSACTEIVVDHTSRRGVWLVGERNLMKRELVTGVEKQACGWVLLRRMCFNY